MFEPSTLTHPLTGQPIVPLGFRKNGLPIWPIIGAAEDESSSSDGGGGESSSTDGGESSSDDGGGTEWDETKAKAEIARLRKENASARTQAKKTAAEEARKALAEEIGKAIGLIEGDKAPTVEELTKQLNTTSSGFREAQAELVVWRNASKLEVDVAALTDSRAFTNAIKDLDPTSKTFVEDVKKAAQEAAEQNPRLKAAPGAGTAGTDHAGGSGEDTGGKSPEDVVKAALAR